MHASDLPVFNAVFNALSGVFLFTGWCFIRTRHVRAHIAMMCCALVASTVFLAGYIANHIINGIVYFPGRGLVRIAYFVLLDTHTFLAVVVLPMVICTLIPALQKRFDKHRRIARWTFPVWLYVSVTGVIVYFMLYRWYPSAAVPITAAR